MEIDERERERERNARPRPRTTRLGRLADSTAPLAATPRIAAAPVPQQDDLLAAVVFGKTGADGYIHDQCLQARSKPTSPSTARATTSRDTRAASTLLVDGRPRRRLVTRQLVAHTARPWLVRMHTSGPYFRNLERC
eukprot:scaffold7380_cov45-Phaeocystis_antarctica.AAC.2